MESLISVDPEVMGGIPCFAGSRLPVKTVLECLAQGDSFEVLQQSWPFLTLAHVAAARAYAAANPELVQQRPAWVQAVYGVGGPRETRKRFPRQGSEGEN